MKKRVVSDRTESHFRSGGLECATYNLLRTGGVSFYFLSQSLFFLAMGYCGEVTPAIRGDRKHAY